MSEHLTGRVNRKPLVRLMSYLALVPVLYVYINPTREALFSVWTAIGVVLGVGFGISVVAFGSRVETPTPNWLHPLIGGIGLTLILLLAWKGIRFPTDSSYSGELLFVFFVGYLVVGMVRNATEVLDSRPAVGA